LRILLDENLSLQQAVVLRRDGHDAVAVTEAGLSGASDDRVREFAIHSGRVLITLDADFANVLRFPPVGTPGIIRLKIHPPREEGIRQLIRRTLDLLKDASVEGCLAVSDGKMIRIRR
jgi:predicted nuclease of predicted toxin-antitoxin system